MKHTALILTLCFSLLQAQTIFQDGFEADPCAIAIPSDWYVVGWPLYTDSCGGYATQYGTEPPIGEANNHYIQLRTLDKSKPDGRDYVGHILPNAIHAGDVIYFEMAVSHAERTEFFTDGLSLILADGEWPIDAPRCSDANVVWRFGHIFTVDTSWTLIGGFVNVTADADRFMIGNPWCDDMTNESRDVNREHPKAVYSIDNVTISRISVGVDDPITEDCTFIGSFDILGRPIQGDMHGLRFNRYLCGGQTMVKKTWQ